MRFSRMLQGQSLRELSREMGINESWASVVVNSPVFQDELERRLDLQEKALIEKLAEREQRRLEAPAGMMRGGRGVLSVRDESSGLERFQRETVPADSSECIDPGLGDRLVRVLGRERKAHPARAEL